MCELLTFSVNLCKLSCMKTEPIDVTQDLPVMISDAAWQSLHPFLKTLPNVYVGAPEACRRFLSALIWITKEGATWRSLPKVYGYWNPAPSAGVFEKLHDHFHEAGDFSADGFNDCAGPFFRSGCSKKKRRSAIEALRSSGGFTTKLNAAVNDAFLPLRFT